MQEADIQRHRQRLINQGHIEDIAAGAFGPRRQQTLEQSAQTFEVCKTITLYFNTEHDVLVFVGCWMV